MVSDPTPTFLWNTWFVAWSLWPRELLPNSVTNGHYLFLQKAFETVRKNNTWPYILTVRISQNLCSKAWTPCNLSRTLWFLHFLRSLNRYSLHSWILSASCSYTRRRVAKALPGNAFCARAGWCYAPGTKVFGFLTVLGIFRLFQTVVHFDNLT